MIIRFFTFALWTVISAYNCFGCEQDDVSARMAALSVSPVSLPPIVEAALAYSRDSQDSTATCAQNMRLAVSELFLESVGADLIAEACDAQGVPFEERFGRLVGRFIKSHKRDFSGTFLRPGVGPVLEQVKPYALKAVALGEGDLMQRWSTSDGVQEEVMRLNCFRDQRRAALERLLSAEIDLCQAFFGPESHDVRGVKQTLSFLRKGGNCTQEFDKNDPLLRYVLLKFLDSSITSIVTKGAAQARVPENVAQQLRVLVGGLSVISQDVA